MGSVELTRLSAVWASRKTSDLSQASESGLCDPPQPGGGGPASQTFRVLDPMGATLPCNMTSSLWSLDEYLLDTYHMATAALLREETETESLLSTSFNGTAGDTYTGEITELPWQKEGCRKHVEMGKAEERSGILRCVLC